MNFYKSITMRKKIFYLSLVSLVTGFSIYNVLSVLQPIRQNKELLTIRVLATETVNGESAVTPYWVVGEQMVTEREWKGFFGTGYISPSTGIPQCIPDYRYKSCCKHSCETNACDKSKQDTDC